jgi:hypothetical protein
MLTARADTQLVCAVSVMSESIDGCNSLFKSICPNSLIVMMRVLVYSQGRCLLSYRGEIKMSQRKDQIVAVEDKLKHVTTVLLKKWAGFSGFYGFKAMGYDELFALLNTNGWKVIIDDSVSPYRIVELYQGETRVRREKYSTDEAGRVHKV